MFWKKKKEEERKMPNTTKKSCELLKIEKPQICIFDPDDKTIQVVENSSFNFKTFSLGQEIKVPNSSKYDKHLCLMNHNFPQNSHEYDIVVICSDKKPKLEYKDVSNYHEESKDYENHYILSKFPQTIFDPRPLAASRLSDSINKMLKRKSILVIFASTPSYELDYRTAKMTENGYSENNKLTAKIYDYYKRINILENKTGTIASVVTKNDSLRSILNELIDEINYKLVFYHPTQWNEDTQKNEPIKTFYPLMKDSENEIISYLNIENESIILVLPEVKDKGNLIVRLLNEFFPEIIPDIFPYSTTFRWKDNEEFWLPGHKELLDKKRIIEETYQKKLVQIKSAIEKNKDDFSFLHNIISLTSDELVLSVKQYLEWLGFKNIKIMDDESDLIKEEDIQIENERGLLLLEIKGIGGTSKDSDCSQVSKIVNRRQKERKSFDVHGVYLVNHQRYLPPDKRNNPPFTQNQIKDSEYDERGLLTTYDLFKLYFDINKDIITKESARETFYSNGIIGFNLDDKNHIANVDEIYQNGTVCIVNITNIELKVGQEIIVEKAGKREKTTILDIQINDTSVMSASTGKIGIKFNTKIKKKSNLYKI